MKKPFYGGWIVAACFLTFGISTGFPYYNIFFFFDYFRDHHGWPMSLITLGAPVAVLLTIWVGPVIVPKVSPRLLIIIGTGMTFLSFQWFSRLSGATWEYFAAWALYMIGYFLSGPIPHQIIISNWYKAKRGRAMGIAYVGVAVVGAAGARYGAPYLISDWHMHYTKALQCMSFLFLLAWPIAFFVIKDKPEDIGQLPDGALQPASAAPVVKEATKSFGFLLRQKPFWLLLIGSAASIGAIAAVNIHMKLVFESQGYVTQTARNQIWSTATQCVLLSGIAGRLLAGYLADKFPKKYVMLVTYLVVALAIPTLFLVTPAQGNYVYLFAIVFGFAMGADYMLIPLMAADQFGLATLAVAMSAILPTDTISQFWFPNLIARVKDFTGSYETAMLTVFAVAFIGALAIGFLPKHGARKE